MVLVTPPALFENIYYVFFFSSELKFLFEFTNQFLIIEMRTQTQFVILSSSTALGSQTGWWWSNIDCSVCIFSFMFTSAKCLHYLSFWTECVPRLQPKSRRNLWSFLVQVASKYAESLTFQAKSYCFRLYSTNSIVISDCTDRPLIRDVRRLNFRSSNAWFKGSYSNPKRFSDIFMPKYHEWQ